MLILLLAEPLVNGYEYVGPYSVIFEFKFYCNIVLVSLPRIPEDVMSPLFPSHSLHLCVGNVNLCELIYATEHLSEGTNEIPLRVSRMRSCTAICSNSTSMHYYLFINCHMFQVITVSKSTPV